MWKEDFEKADRGFEVEVLEGFRFKSEEEKNYCTRSSWMFSMADLCISRFFVSCAPLVPRTTLCIVNNNKPITTVDMHSVLRDVKKQLWKCK